MSDPPAVTVLTREPGSSRSHLHLAPPTPAVPTTLTFEAAEIVAPDRYCAELLLDHAESLFPAAASDRRRMGR